MYVELDGEDGLGEPIAVLLSLEQAYPDIFDQYGRIDKAKSEEPGKTVLVVSESQITLFKDREGAFMLRDSTVIDLPYEGFKWALRRASIACEPYLGLKESDLSLIKKAYKEHLSSNAAHNPDPFRPG